MRGSGRLGSFERWVTPSVRAVAWAGGPGSGFVASRSGPGRTVVDASITSSRRASLLVRFRSAWEANMQHLRPFRMLVVLLGPVSRSMRIMLTLTAGGSASRASLPNVRRSRSRTRLRSK